MPLGPHGNTPSTPAIAADDERAACQQPVSGPDNTIYRALACPITIIKKVLGIGVVYRNDGEL